MALQDEELMTLTGGAVNYGLWTIVGGVITFVIGIIDGYLRPLACNR